MGADPGDPLRVRWQTRSVTRSEYARGFVHANSAESFNDRVRRTIAGVFHHISPEHADLYFNEVSFRWSQLVKAGNAVRRTRTGREVVKPLWSRIAPALQLAAVFRSAVGRPIAPDRERRNSDPVRGCCVWLIKPALSG